MWTMKLLSSVFIVLLFPQISTGDKSCEISSSAGRVVHKKSSFRVYCTFNFECSRPSMYSGHPPRAQLHQSPNSTTVYLEVVDLTEGRTFSCDCDVTDGNADNKPDSCGLDISAGYPPDVPTNISCIYKVALSKVACTWDSGRKTHLRNSTSLWVRTFTHNALGGSQLFSVSAKQSASLLVNSSAQLISVWVNVTNSLGSAESPVINYTLTDIMMPDPPVLHKLNCSSRNCSIRVEPALHLDICYREDSEEWTLTNPFVSNDSVLVSSLLPFRLYHFRARSRFRTGLWSDWSHSVSSWTQEEAPAVALDMWYAVDHSEKSMRVYWKKLHSLFAHGKILDYIITVYKQHSTQILNASAEAQSLSVPFCIKCEVTVCARNSRGRSPPANITIHNTTAKPPLKPAVNNQNVTIYWGNSGTAPLPLEYVVEWFPRGQRLDKLRWVRLGRNISHVVITDMEPFVCYEGAVYVFYRNNSVGRHAFPGVNTAASVPTAGPSVQEMEEGSTVNVTWSELPMSQRRGCITKYTVYLENSNGCVTYNLSASQRFFILRDLAPAFYSIWMTASTAEGEGKPGPKVKFYISGQDSHVPLIITFGTLLIFGGLFVFCACQSTAVKKRVWVYFQYCRPEDIPDPANSKWAKECLQGKGRQTLQLQLSSSTASEEEEDLVLVDILEVPRPLLFKQTSLNSVSELSSPLCPHIEYIKSHSHDSSSSGDTQTSSLDTNETADYISSPGTAAISEEEEEDMEEVHGFFPSHSFSMKPMNFGPKLTLDTLRIDGKDCFLQCD